MIIDVLPTKNQRGKRCVFALDPNIAIRTFNVQLSINVIETNAEEFMTMDRGSSMHLVVKGLMIDINYLFMK